MQNSYSITRVLALVFGLMIHAVLGQAPSDHRLSAGDSVTVKVFGEPECDTVSALGKDGQITVPYAGGVRVEGMTATEAAKAIAQAYRTREYLANPNVTVTITATVVGAASRKRFSVTGQVLRPGPFYFPPGEDVSLIQALSIAGGHTRIANLSKVTIQRGSQVIKVDAKKLTKEGGVAPKLQPGDVVNVPEGW